MKIKNIKNPLSDYENKWVAMTTDYSKVIEAANKPEELEKKLSKQKIKNVVLLKVGPFKYFAP